MGIENEITKIIDAMIGSYEEQRNLLSQASITTRIKGNERYRKLRERLCNYAVENSERLLTISFTQQGVVKSGTTPNGKTFTWVPNIGLEERSRYCGTLSIDGKVVFTSGSVQKALEYILDN